MTTFYVVRHGESDANISELFGLNPQSSLTEKGKRQAKILSDKFLSNVTFDFIFLALIYLDLSKLQKLLHLKIN